MRLRIYGFMCFAITVLQTINCNEIIRYAAILYRHGDRTPVDTYPEDPWKNESLWPVGFGQLTNTGKKQHYALGLWLRGRYDHLISAKFDPKEIYVRSTDVDRTLMSAMANLAGMYPPVADSVWNPNLNWQPIPVHTEPQDEDELLSMNKKCPNYDEEYEKYRQSPEYKDRLAQYEPLMKYISENTGIPIRDYYDILDIYTTLKIEQLNNFTLPEWTEKVFPAAMMEPAAYSFTTETATPFMARLKVGPFLKEVVNNMVKVMHDYNSKIPYHDVEYDDLDGVPPLKLNVYSAHDLNIASVLNALGLYDNKCPEFTATILFELVYDNSTEIHFVKIMYRNTVDIVEPVNLYIPGCGLRCPLERFVKLYDSIIPEDWEEECTTKFPLALALTCIFGLMFYICSYICYYFPYCNKAGKRQRGTYYSTVRPGKVTVRIAEPN